MKFRFFVSVFVAFLLFSPIVKVFSATPQTSANSNPVYITNVERAEFLKAAEQGNLATIKSMVEKMPEIIKTRDKDEWTALLYAARFGKLEVVKYLLDKGASVDEMDLERTTALHNAAAFDHKAVCEYLIKKGAKVNARTQGAVTPRRLAESNGHDKTASFLSGKGGVR